MTLSDPWPQVDSTAVRDSLRRGAEIALLDVRPEADFATGHPLFAASLPLGRIETEVLDRIPNRNVPVVLLDDGEGPAPTAARLLGRLGYTDVSLLADGLAGWRASGGELFTDVNVPSKAFGELVADRRDTPSLSADEVAALLDREANVTVVDMRRFDEYQTMSIPGAVSVPGGELVYRLSAVAPDPTTLVIVNCAGRTRSIIGTQSLVNAGIANPVAALRNGTIGWTLAGHRLESGAARRASTPDEHGRAHAAARARRLAEAAGVRALGPDDLAALDRSRTVYRFDVRTPEEFEAGHLPGFRPAPGGQLVQETDAFAPVRGALVVLADDDGVRANMTGSWLAQMGWEVGVISLPAAGLEPGAWVPTLSPPSTSARGSTSAPTTDPEPAGTLASDTGDDVYRRPYEGTDVSPAVMQAYLDWEYGLVAQLDRDGTHRFSVV